MTGTHPFPNIISLIMRILSVIICILLLNSFETSSQTPPVKYGEVTKADLETEPYPQEKGAEAIVLSEFATAKVVYNREFKIEYTYQVRIKILKSGGYRFANVEIPYRKNYMFSNLKACTHNLENGIPVTISLNKKQFVREKVTPYRDAFRFTLPQVRQGSIVEYTYTVQKPSILSFQSFEFQWDIPVRHVEFWAIQPRFFRYNINFHGNDLILQQHSEQQGYFDAQPTMVDIYKYIGDMVPAFEGEPVMPEGNVSYAGVDFSLARVDFPGVQTTDVAISYPKLSEELLDNVHLASQVENTLLFAKTVREITAGKSTDLDKLRTIYGYVQKSFMWDGYDELLPEDNLLKVFRDKSGSSAEINMLLVNMLKTAEIKADPVVLSTRDNGPINNILAMTDNLNYSVCLAEVNGKEYLLDATDKFIPMGSLPFKCQNVDGWVLSKTRGRWVKLLTNEKYAVQEFYALTCKPDGDLVGKCEASFSGYDAVNYRRLIHNEGETGFRYKVMEKPGLNYTISNLVFESLDSLSKVLNVSFDIVIHNAFHSGTDMEFFNPMFSIFGDYNKTWVKEERKFAIDMGCPTRNNYTCIIEFPEGTGFSEIPGNIKLTLPNDEAAFQFITIQEGRQLSVKYDLKINKSRFETNVYPAFREFYTQVNRKINEMVILNTNQK